MSTAILMIIPLIVAVGVIYITFRVGMNWASLPSGVIVGVIVFVVVNQFTGVAVSLSTVPYSLTVTTASLGAASGDALGKDALDTMWQQKAFYSNGYYYVVYGDTDGSPSGRMLYRSSADGVTWAAASTFSSLARHDDRYALWPTGSQLHTAYSGKVANGLTSQYRLSTLGSNGVITLGAWNDIVAGANTEDYNAGALTTDNHFVYTFMNLDDANKMYSYVGDVSSGAWVNEVGSPFKLTNAAPAVSYFARVVPLTGGQAYVFIMSPSTSMLYGIVWDGAAWGTLDTLMNGTMPSGNTLAVGLMPSGQVMMATIISPANTWQYRFRSVAGVWGAWTTFTGPPTACGWALMSTHTSRNEAHLFYESTNVTHRYIYALRYRDGIWDSTPTVIADAGADTIARPAPVQHRYANNIGLGYITGTVHPYTINYAAIKVNGS